VLFRSHHGMDLRGRPRIAVRVRGGGRRARPLVRTGVRPSELHSGKDLTFGPRRPCAQRPLWQIIGPGSRDHKGLHNEMKLRPDATISMCRAGGSISTRTRRGREGAVERPWLVNSATHMWDSRRFATRDDSRNNWWVALITLGRGLAQQPPRASGLGASRPGLVRVRPLVAARSSY
jgi:hypothetical protein